MYGIYFTGVKQRCTVFIGMYLYHGINGNAFMFLVLHMCMFNSASSVVRSDFSLH